jgi:hypothetical protein
MNLSQRIDLSLSLLSLAAVCATGCTAEQREQAKSAADRAAPVADERAAACETLENLKRFTGSDRFDDGLELCAGTATVQEILATLAGKEACEAVH